MTATFIIGLILFIVSILLSILAAFGAMSKNVGVSTFGALQVLILLISPCFFFLMELVIYHYAPEAFGVAYLFVFMNILLIAMQYIMLIGAAVFTKNSIYRLTKALIFKRYAYEDVIGYDMKKSSGIIRTRLGKKKVVTFDVKIYFNNGQCAFFSTKEQTDRKAMNIKQLLEEHHCHKNGRIRRERRIDKQ